METMFIRVVFIKLISSRWLTVTVDFLTEGLVYPFSVNLYTGNKNKYGNSSGNFLPLY